MKPVTETMLEAIEFAKQNSNRLIRHNLGRWAGEKYWVGDEYFTASTIRALIARKLIKPTKYVEWKGEQYPSEVTLTEKAMI